MFFSMKRPKTGRQPGFAWHCWGLHLFWRRCGTSQAKDRQRDRQAGQAGIVEDEPESCRGKRDRNQHYGWPHQVEERRQERDPAEHTIIVEDNHQPERRTKPARLAGLAGQRHGGMFDGKVTKVKRLANGQKTNNQQPTNLPRRWGIYGIMHCALVIGHRSDLFKMSALLRNASTSANFAEPQRNDLGVQTVQHLFEIVYNSDS